MSTMRRRPHGAPAYIQRSAIQNQNNNGDHDNDDDKDRKKSGTTIAGIVISLIIIYYAFRLCYSSIFKEEHNNSIRGSSSSAAASASASSALHNTTKASIIEDSNAQHKNNYHEEEIAMGEELLQYEKEFVAAARSLQPITDKVTTHRYYPMYGQFLLPYYKRNTHMKMLEIGLGCDMNYEPGASVALWKKLFPEANLWEAEYNETCVEVSKKQGKLDGFHTLVGDQGNNATLDSWIEKSGGNFDVIIDDGGHQNCQIMASFIKLWPTLKPGGLYFIEDIQVGKWRANRRYSTATCDKEFTFSDKLQVWLDDIIYQGGYGSHKWDVQFLYCQAEACVLRKRPPEVATHYSEFSKTELLPDQATFVETAAALKPITDKITTHSFQTMYGEFLLPYYRRKPNMKMLEIGLGCDMNYDPGASVALWKKLFPQADLWEAEYDGKCVEKAKAEGKLDGFNVLVGDQGNNATLDSWIEKSESLKPGKGFDIIIDDGGHHNCQIKHSFDKLWPALKPGGLYFLEDLSVGKWMGYRRYSTATCPKTFIFSHKLQEWLEDLIYQGGYGSHKWNVQFLFCQAEACVLRKKPLEINS